eukprot:PRCOL_00005812-RA
MAAAAAAAAVGGEDVDAGRPAVARVRALLGRRCRATLADGRALEGALHCADKQGNIILTDTVETRSAPEGSNAAETTQTRTLGMVLIPDKHRVGFEVEATDEERLEWMSLGD